MSRFNLQRKQLVPVLAVLAIAITGTIILTASHAATPFVSAEPENGTTTAPASSVTDTTASGGKAVKFATAGVTPTPTPTPTPPAGGGCPAWPAFPTTACTGVPAGYTLAASVSSLSSTAAGQTIDGKLITGDLNIGHNNVTVTNSRIKGHVNLNGHTGIVLQNVDLGPDSCPATGNGGTRTVNGNNGYSLIRTHVHNNGDDLMLIGGGSPVLYQDSIVDKGCFYPADHLDAVQWYDPGALGHIAIAHSIIDVTPANSTDKGNAAFFFADGAGSGTTITLYNNKFGGGQITTSFYDALKGTGIVVDVHDNVYIKNSYATRPCASTNSITFDGTSGVKFTNNKFEDGTAVSC